MFQSTIDLTSFILTALHPDDSYQGDLTILLTQLAYASKIIGSHMRQAGLVDIYGKTGAKNAYAEEVAKMDTLSNDILITILRATNTVGLIGSEELPTPIEIHQGKRRFAVFFDPLDGSSNIENGMPVGTIFSIYDLSLGQLQRGNKQIASGYALYSTTDMFVFTLGNGVNGFTFDPSIGSFLLSHPQIMLPTHGTTYAVNEGNSTYWDMDTKNYLQFIHEVNKVDKRPYSLRYCGSMVGDMHRILMNGGIFLYPQDQKNPTGKLRLLYEINPFAFIIQQAGGNAVTRLGNPLDILPILFDQRTDIAIGSKLNVEEYSRFVR